MLVAKPGRLGKVLVCYFGRSNIKIFRPEIMGLKKGDTAEIIGNWGPYRDVLIHKYTHPITLTDNEIDILFSRQ